MQTSESPLFLEVEERSPVSCPDLSAPYPAAGPIPGAPKGQFIPYLIFTVAAGLYFLPFMRVMLGNGDEGLLVSGAARILHGQVFARDFFEVVGPGTFYWLALFFKLLGVTFLATRISLFIASLGTGLAMYFLSRRICKRYQVLPSILLVGTYFGSSWPAVSHHVDSNLFALLAIVCVVCWQDTRHSALLLAGGALAGAATLVFQPKGMLLLAALLVWLWIEHRRRSSPLSSLGLLAASYAGVIVSMLIYFWSRHALWDLLYVNVLWPSRHYSAVNIVPYAQGIVAYYWDHFIIAKSGFGFTIFTASLLIAPFLLVAALPVLLPALAFPFAKTALRPGISLYWLCGAALWASEIHRKDICHLVFGSPLLLILFVYYAGQYRGKIADLGLQILAISASCLAGFNLFLVLAAHPAATRAGTVAFLRNDPVVALLQSKVSPGEEIFAYPYCAMYYFLSGTQNPTRYAALMYDFNTPDQFEEAVRVLEQRRVKYVVWNKGFLDNNAKVLFPKMNKVKDDQLIIEPYLLSHYKVLGGDADTQLLERKDDHHAN